MGFGNFFRYACRVLQMVAAFAVIGLGAWITHSVHDIEIRGDAVLGLIELPNEKEDIWTDFFDSVQDAPIRIWVSIGAGCWTFLAALFLLMAPRLRADISRWTLLVVDVFTMFVMAGAFAATLSLSIVMEQYCPNLDVASNAQLRMFAMLCPLGESYAISAGVGWFLLAVTATSGLIENTCHGRGSKALSFEPTASALGMGHGYQAEIPSTAKGAVPTMYDPRKPASSDEEKELRNEGAAMGRRDSGLSEHQEREISGPMNFQQMKNFRPARPWSEMPKRNGSSGA